MIGAMFIGLSGMTAYSNGLRQVSNNITNLNSIGFRASDLSFTDQFSENTRGLSYSDNGRGSGVEVMPTRLDFSQGDLRQTDSSLDLGISGNGFLVLERDGEYFYARTGSFQVGADGDIVLSGTDYKLAVINENGQVETVSIDANRNFPATPTTTIQFSENLSSTASEHFISDITVYDGNGSNQNWDVRFYRNEDDDAGVWNVAVTVDDGTQLDEQIIRFNNGVIDPTADLLTFEDPETGLSIVLDLSEGVSSFSTGEISSLRVSDVDGYGLGELVTLGVNTIGELEAGYSNEQTRSLGAVALADFDQVQNLEQIGAGLFSYSQSSGRRIMTTENSQVGQVLSNRLEASNVDLSQQFGELILVQRGYQASSQVVSISNEMIQQLFSINR